ncbi:MAG: hypothetical protein ACLR23_11090 [Clostridia bacterium]
MRPWTASISCGSIWTRGLRHGIRTVIEVSAVGEEQVKVFAGTARFNISRKYTHFERTKHMDRFAQIAKEGVSVQERGLIIPEPEKKDVIFLQNISDARYQFTPLKNGLRGRIERSAAGC